MGRRKRGAVKEVTKPRYRPFLLPATGLPAHLDRVLCKRLLITHLHLDVVPFKRHRLNGKTTLSVKHYKIEKISKLCDPNTRRILLDWIMQVSAVSIVLNLYVSMLNFYI
jgi:hypothetical protein